MLVSLSKESIRPLIELNDRINTLTEKERTINSTRIVVVGDQSHGKSSVLEALSGVDLPRGEDIKTRVPLQMQLRSTDGEEHAMISIQSDTTNEPEKIALMDVAAKVDEYTARIAGAEKMVVDSPIVLKVFRRDQDDLTLVDLPGLTRTSREGQSASGKELETLILKMFRRYCEPQETVILNVVSAMVDFSTSASLQLSQELDPASRRTILCVTKIDQHREEGLDKKLSNAASQLRMQSDRVFAVRNRNQKENAAKVSLADARRTETDFFEAHPEINGAKLCGYGLGVRALSNRLVSIQVERIQETLPGTYHAIDEMRERLRARSNKIGLPLGDEISCRVMASNLVDRFVEELTNERSGRGRIACASERSPECEEEDCGQLLCATLRDLDDDFAEKINEAINDTSILAVNFKAKLKKAAEARRGAVGLPGAIAPEVPMSILSDLRKKLPRIVTEHVDEVSRAVREKIKQVVDACVDQQVHPRFHNLCLRKAYALVEECHQAAQRECARMLEYEDAEIHTSNHDYMDIVQDQRRKIKEDDDQELVDLQIKTFAYGKTLKKRLIDYVQMAARYNLSTELIEQKLRPALRAATENEKSACRLMAPDDAVARERKHVAARLEALDEAHRLLESRDIPKPEAQAVGRPALQKAKASATSPALNFGRLLGFPSSWRD